MCHHQWRSRRQQWVPEKWGIKVEVEDARKMENQPIEIIQLAFKSRRLLMFANRTGKPVDMGEMVVVSVDRGEDMGRVVAKLPASEVNTDRIEGDFLRLSTEADMEKFIANRDFEKQVLLHCETRIKVRNLDMFLSDCESQLDRNRIRIFFTADQRTDFRGLVRDMASAFRARIEMRQIGVRDDAKYKDGVGICGRQLCCAGFLNEFKSVTLKSVRDQHLSPNPSKVSGACSRLMCCLEYETEFYHKASKTYPRVGINLKVNGLHACVKNANIFKETVTLQWDESGNEETLSIEDFHRRRAMSTLPKSASETGKGSSIPTSRVNEKERQKKSVVKPADKVKAPPVETKENSEKPEKKSRGRNRPRYRRRNNKKEERKS